MQGKFHFVWLTISIKKAYALPQPKVLWLKDSEIYNSLKQHNGNPAARACGILIKSQHVIIQGKI